MTTPEGTFGKKRPYFLPVALIVLLLASVLPTRNVCGQGKRTRETLPEATAKELPRWRGFNLLGKFHRDWSNEGFQEEDFQIVSELGFNFVRLPMDYRTWIQGDDWTQLDETALLQIDQAVQWGQTYNVHVCLNFHRAPGYTVASPAEEKNLWTDRDAQRVCGLHWAEFAKRYKGIPNRNLSFNLFNEPVGVSEQELVKVTQKIVAEIRREDPSRLIICDGLRWGAQPVTNYGKLNVAQATRGYTPHVLSHYRADWIDGSERHPDPKWPRPHTKGILYGQTRGDLTPETRRPLEINGYFPEPTRMRIRVGTVSSDARLLVRAGRNIILDKTFHPGPGEGEWKTSRYSEQWQIYENDYDRDYYATIPAGTRKIELLVTNAGWISISEVAIKNNQPDGSSRKGQSEYRLQLNFIWGEPPSKTTFSPTANHHKFQTDELENRKWLWDTQVSKWFLAGKRHGFGVMVGEFGCLNHTPHDVTLAWMEDCLKNYRRANFGWALWNLRGPFGILDSERKDVRYQRYRGHQLDRKMLDLLRRY